MYGTPIHIPTAIFLIIFTNSSRFLEESFLESFIPRFNKEREETGGKKQIAPTVMRLARAP